LKKKKKVESTPVRDELKINQQVSETPIFERRRQVSLILIFKLYEFFKN